MGIPGSVCERCYAREGWYPMGHVRRAHEKRMEGFQHPQWREAMTVVLNSEKVQNIGVFRWFDSGDVQSFDHLLDIVQIAIDTAPLRHWLPTREYGFVRRLGAESVPDNMVIRLSAPMMDGPAPPNWPTTSGVIRHKEISQGKICPSRDNGHRCGDCRMCWDKDEPHIDYEWHSTKESVDQFVLPIGAIGARA